MLPVYAWFAPGAQLGVVMEGVFLLSTPLAPEQLLRPRVNSQGAITLQKLYHAAVFKGKMGKKRFWLCSMLPGCVRNAFTTAEDSTQTGH